MGYRITIEDLRGQNGSSTNGEVAFEYPIINSSVKYDPESYISYDYMVSTARQASFSCYVGKLGINNNARDFVDSVIKINNDNPTANDIILYNYFYYDADVESERLIRTSGELYEYENTNSPIGVDIHDENGILRTISSYEKISEGISTLMCRIYEQALDGTDILVYSGLINKEETSVKDEVLKIGLVDTMYMITEIGKKFSITPSSSTYEYKFVSIENALNSFIFELSKYTGIDISYFGNTLDYVFNNDTIQKEYNSMFRFIEKDLSSFNPYYVPNAFSSSMNVSISNSYIELEPTFDDFANVPSDSSNFFTSIGNYVGDTSEVNLYYPVMRTKFSYDTLTGEINPDGYAYVSVVLLYSQYVNTFIFTNQVNFSEFEATEYVISNQTIISIYGDEVDELDLPLLLYNDDIVGDDGITIKGMISNTERIISKYYGTGGGFVKFVDDGTIFSYTEINGEKWIAIEQGEADVELYDESMIYAEGLQIAPNGEDSDLAINFNISLNCLRYNNYYNFLPLYIDKSYSIYSLLKLYSRSILMNISTTNDGKINYTSSRFNATNYTFDIDDLLIKKPFSIASLISNQNESTIFDDVYEGENGLKKKYKMTRLGMFNKYVNIYKADNKLYSFLIKNDKYTCFNSSGWIQLVKRKIMVKDEINVKNGNNTIFSIFVSKITPIFNGQVIKVEGKSI